MQPAEWNAAAIDRPSSPATDVAAHPHRPGPDARRLLQAATDASHRRMHRHPGFAALAAGSIDRDGYRHLLARCFGFHAAMRDFPIAVATARRLQSDLRALGMTAAAIAALPRCPGLPQRFDSAAATGASYVILGATLGGTVMTHALRRRFGDTAPVAFLGGGGSAEWTHFARGLDAALADDAARATAVATAVTIFETFEAWMDGWMPSDE